MKKEVILAILTGSLLGVFLGFGFWKANRAVKNKVEEGITPTNTPDIKTLYDTHEADTEFKVNQPLDHQVFFNDIATISGIAAKKSPLAIITETQDYLLLSDETGKFSQTVSLVKGINEIKLTQIDNFERSQSIVMNLIYTADRL